MSDTEIERQFPKRLTIAVDLSFDEKMTDKCNKKTCLQLKHCYAQVRRSPNVSLWFTSFDEKYKEITNQIDPCFSVWNVDTSNVDFMTTFPHRRKIYLTPDSDKVLDKLDLDAVYIVGGIVDRNSHKNICLNKAVELGIEHARLPIKEHVKLNCSYTLSFFHALEILIKVNSGLSWHDALKAVIPKRKILSIKTIDENV